MSDLRQIIHNSWYFETGPDKRRKRTTRRYPTITPIELDWLERLPIKGSKCIPEIIGEVLVQKNTSTVLCLLALSVSFESTRSAIDALRKRYQLSDRVPAEELMLVLPPVL